MTLILVRDIAGDVDVLCHGVTFQRGSARMFSTDMFEIYFSYHKDICNCLLIELLPSSTISIDSCISINKFYRLITFRLLINTDIFLKAKLGFHVQKPGSYWDSSSVVAHTEVTACDKMQNLLIPKAVKDQCNLAWVSGSL